MGRLPGYRQVTLYMDPKLYEQVKCSASTLGEHIYEMAEEALKSAIERRLTKRQRDVVDSMARQNLNNGASSTKRR